MNKLIMTLAVAAAIALGGGTAGMAFADETPSNDASQGPVKSLKEGPRERPKKDANQDPKCGARHRCRNRPERGFDRGEGGDEGPKERPSFKRGRGTKDRPRFDRGEDGDEGQKERPGFKRGRGSRPGRDGGRKGHCEDPEDTED